MGRKITTPDKVHRGKPARKGKMFLEVDILYTQEVNRSILLSATQITGEPHNIEIILPDGCNWCDCDITNIHL